MIQAILVLGHLMDSHGNLSEQSLSRCLRAVELAREKNPSFVFSSGAAYRPDSNLALGDVIQRQLKVLIDPESTTFISDTNSRDTVGDAFFSKYNLAVPNKVERLFVVTSLFHGIRSREIFRFVYGDALEVEVLTDQDQGTDEQRMHESGSLLKFQKSISGLHPGDDRVIKSVVMANHPLYRENQD